MRIEVIEASDDGLARVRWFFWVNYPALVFDEYRSEARPSKRHKFGCLTCWSRLDRRGNRIPMPSLPASVAVAAVVKAGALITVEPSA
jgi:hypothetical protein